MLENNQSHTDKHADQSESTKEAELRVAVRSILSDSAAQNMHPNTGDAKNFNPHSNAENLVPPLAIAEQRDSNDNISKPGTYNETMMVDGNARQVRIHVPTNYDASKPMPLVVVLHGHGENLDDIERISGMDAEADKKGFIVAYPAAEQWLGVKSLSAWDTGNGLLPPGESANDISFIRKVMDNCQSRLSIDPKRIDLVGYSNGGMEAYKAAGELSDKLAAVVDISGAMGGAEKKPDSPVSLKTIVGTSDIVVPPSGRTPDQEAEAAALTVMPVISQHIPDFLKGTLDSPVGSEIVQEIALQLGIVPNFKPVTYATDFFKSADGISGPGTVTKDGPSTTETYTNPQNGVTVEQQTIDGGNHMVQAGTPAGFNLADDAWTFLAAHPKVG